LLSLLILTTLVCLALGLGRKGGSRAVASFRVRSQQFSTADRGSQFDPQEFEVFKRSQIQAIKSPWLLQAALRDPGVSSLPIFAGREDPVAWLQKNIQADFPQQGEILEISLEGARSQMPELKQVVDAVAKAYQDDYMFRDKMARMSELQSAESRMRDMRLIYEARLRAAGTRTESNKDPIAVRLAEVELETAKQQWTDAMKRAELLKVERDAPMRIQQLHQAIGSEWGFRLW
jgi:hypothetical protein